MFHGFLLPRGPRNSPAALAPRTAGAVPSANELVHRVTVRLAQPGDEAALHRLAALDSSRVPAGTLLLGEMGGGIQAAVPVNGGRPIANPFVRTAELVRLLELRAAQLRELGVAESELAPVIPLPHRRPTLAGRIA